MDYTAAQLDAMNLNELMAIKRRIKDEVSTLNAQVDELKAQERLVDFAAMATMDGQGLERVANDTAIMSITNEVVPQVTDWDAVFEYIVEHNDFSILQRRPAARAYRELQTAGISIPGMEPREIRKLNFRKP